VRWPLTLSIFETVTPTAIIISRNIYEIIIYTLVIVILYAKILSGVISKNRLWPFDFQWPWPLAGITQNLIDWSLDCIQPLHKFHKDLISNCRVIMFKQKAQLMLTRDAFRGQSRSPNIVPFHMLGIVSSCAIVTLSLRRAFFPIFDFKKCHDLEIRVRGHSRSLKVLPFDRLRMISY